MYFKLIKEGLQKEIQSRAEILMEDDEQAIKEKIKFNSFNSDCGGFQGFDDLSEETQERLLDTAKDELESDLEDVFKSGNIALETIIKAIRGLI